MGTEGWSLTSIANLCLGIFDGPHATPAKTDEGPIFLGISNLNTGRLDLTDIEHLSEEDFVTWTRRVTPRAGDVVFSYETRLGEVAMIPEGFRCCLGRRMALMRPNDSIVNPRFLLYAYLGPEFQRTIQTRTIHGSTVDRIPLVEFGSFPIRVPRRVEQDAIAEILGALDDKFELNRRMNETLEATAAALFRAWFVDFEPVRAKAARQAPAGLADEVAALFPDRFQDSTLGPIPEGWNVRPLDEVADFLNGLAMQRFPPTSGSATLPVIKIAELRRGDTIGSDTASADLDPRYIVADGDVLFSWSGSLEVRIWTGGGGALNQHLFKVTSGEFSRWFYYHCILLHLTEFRAIAADKATTMGHIQRHHLHEALVVVPDEGVLAGADAVLAPLHERLVTAEQESRTLATLRDTLLPQLLSGKMCVKAAERTVEAPHDGDDASHT